MPDAPISTHHGFPPDSTRHAACTHLTMTRLFGAHRCYVCNCIPNIGWVYTCTQDHESLPRPTTDVCASSADLDHSSAIEETNSRAANQLSGWIVKAMANGHYTVEQVDIINAQKRKVNETIAALDHSDSTPSSPPGALTSLPFVGTKSRPPLRIITEAAGPKPILAAHEQLVTLRTSPFPECHWSCCHTCRPTYRERSWQSFEGVLARDTAAYAGPEFRERIVTDVKVARNLGLRKPHFRFDNSQEIRTKTSEDHNGVSPDNLFGQTDGEGDEQEGEDTGRGLRASAKRAFRGILLSRRRHSYSGSISKKSGKRSLRGGQETEKFDVKLWKENQLLRDAAKVRLPGEDGTDKLEFEREEVEVEEGVAVTEEAVDLGTADIIFSVSNKK